MSTRKLYNEWALTYDEVENKTKDLEKKAGLATLAGHRFQRVLELGCGTGKNTVWLQALTPALTAVDLSEGMLQKAREKVQGPGVCFCQADITRPWDFVKEKVDLVTCSLILEHIEHLSPVFGEAGKVLLPSGEFYICELHPYKQYSGSKARFETSEGVKVLDCFVHHVSDYTGAAAANGFQVAEVREWFDEDDRSHPPRLLSFRFTKG